jgi:hypothetical protein
MKTVSASLLFALTIAGAAAAQASDTGSRSSIVLFAGGNAAMPGSFRGQTVPLETSGGSVIYNDLKFADAYHDRYSMGAEYDYALKPNLDLFGRYAYQAFNGQEVRVGNFTGPGEDLNQPVRAKFNDSDTQELDVGARYEFNAMKRIRPFVGAAQGAEKLSPTRAEFRKIGSTGFTNVVLGESDTVFQQRIETGLQFTPADKFDLRLSVAANHVNADTKSSDPNLALVGLDNTQADVRNHWEYPVELGGVWKF